MKKTFNLSFFSIFIFGVMFFSSAAFALHDGERPHPPPDGERQNPPSSIKLENPFRFGGNLFTFFEKVINDIILPLGGMLAVLAFIYSGFLYVTAQGDQTKIKTAHKALLYTAIGTAILLGSWAIANAIGATIGQLQTG